MSRENPMKSLLLVLAVAASVPAWATDWKPVKGTYAVTARNYLDPADEEPKDSHLRFQLTGETAKDLYLAMKVAEKPDECTGATAKQIGEMQCLFYKSDKKYACSLALNIAEQKIEYGVAC
jgi:hypothetical protein